MQETNNFGESFLCVDHKLSIFWNYFSGGAGALTNTRLLFQQAARPHFDYFLQRISGAVVGNVELNLIQDSRFRAYLEKVPRKNLEELSLKILQAKNPVYITSASVSQKTKQLKLPVMTVEISDVDMFGNVEPVWRKIRKALNGRQFGSCLVNLGPERVMIIPRLAQVYGVEALDATFLFDRITTKKTLWNRAISFAKRKMA